MRRHWWNALVAQAARRPSTVTLRKRASISEKKMEDSTPGVVLFRVRPAQAAGESIAFMRTIDDRHSTVYIPRNPSLEGDKEVVMWVLWASTKHPSFARSLTTPSLFGCGEKKMAIVHANTDTPTRTAQGFDICSMLGLTNVFNIYSDARLSEHVSEDDKMIVGMLYVMCIRIALDYHSKSLHTNDLMARLTPVFEDYSATLKAAGVDVDSLDTFRRQSQVMAQTLSATSLNNSPSLENGLQMMTLSGTAALVDHSDKVDFHTGFSFFSKNERQLKMIAVHMATANALRGEKYHTLCVTLQRAMLFGERGIAKVTGLHAIIVEQESACARCDVRIPHIAVSTGLCHLCPHLDCILCPKCSESECEACARAVGVIDYEAVAIDALARSTMLMRQRARDNAQWDEVVRRLQAEVAAKQREVDAKQREVDANAIDVNAVTQLQGENANLRAEMSAVRTDFRKERRRNKKSATSASDADLIVRLQHEVSSGHKVRLLSRTAPSFCAPIYVSFRRSQACDAFNATINELHEKKQQITKQLAEEKRMRKNAEAREGKNAEEMAKLEEKGQADATAREDAERRLRAATEQVGILEKSEASLRQENGDARAEYAATIARITLERDIVEAALRRELVAQDEDVTQYEAIRMDLLTTQRAAFAGNTIDVQLMREELEAIETHGTALGQLNAVWREKYAYAAGQAKAKQSILEQLMTRIVVRET